MRHYSGAAFLRNSVIGISRKSRRDSWRNSLRHRDVQVQVMSPLTKTNTWKIRHRPNRAKRRSSERAVHFAGERQVVYYNHSSRILDASGNFRTVNSTLPAGRVITMGAKRFVVRQMDRHVLFRDSDRLPSEDVFYLPDATIDQFAILFGRRPSGRCIMHVPRCMGPNHCIYLFFDSDGTGFALHPNSYIDRNKYAWKIRYEPIDFNWSDIPAAPPDLLSTRGYLLRPLCEILFEERINPLLRNPYPYQNIVQDIPSSWQSGSERELRLLVQAICFTEPGLFDAPETVTVVFRATTPYKRGCFLRAKKIGYYRAASPRLMSLCELAFRLNECAGMEWIEHRGAPCNLQKSTTNVQVEVEPPTGSDREEAHHTLALWLDNTLHNPKKRARYNLPPRSQTRDPA